MSDTSIWNPRNLAINPTPAAHLYATESLRELTLAKQLLGSLSGLGRSMLGIYDQLENRLSDIECRLGANL